jgi:hypothetical protein
MTVGEKISDFQTCAHGIHGFVELTAHAHLGEQSTHQLTGLVDPLLFSPDFEKPLYAHTFVFGPMLGTRNGWWSIVL